MRMPPRITKPSFFKVLLGDFAERLRIPPKFTKHILKEATRVAILQSRKGRYWKVEIRKNSQGTFLWNGWKKFVSDHSLREHDFLVFRYDGDMHFSVTIFDKSACEREYGPKTKLSKNRSISEGRDELTRPVKRDLDVGYLLQHNTTRKKWPQNLSKNMYQDHQGRIKRTPKPKKHAKITNDGDVSPIRVLAPDAKYTNDYSCHRLIAIHQEPSKALEAAKSFNSMFPYFVTRMTSSKVSNRYMLVKKIVQGSIVSFRTMYRPFLHEYMADGLLKFSSCTSGQTFKQDHGLLATSSLVSSLPSTVQSRMLTKLGGNRGSLESGGVVPQITVSSREEAAKCVSKVLRRLVMVSSARQAVSGVLAAGGVNALCYVARKMSKAWKSRT